MSWVDPLPSSQKGMDRLKKSLTVHTVCDIFLFKSLQQQNINFFKIWFDMKLYFSNWKAALGHFCPQNHESAPIYIFRGAIVGKTDKTLILQK